MSCSFPAGRPPTGWKSIRGAFGTISTTAAPSSPPAKARASFSFRASTSPHSPLISAPEHPLFEKLGQRDISWHLHGWFDAPEGAEILAVNGEGKPILYIDEVTTKGRMVVTSLDPFFHHGSHFMPATTRFLDGFLPWMRNHLDKDSA
jgi:hypothetical protein